MWTYLAYILNGLSRKFDVNEISYDILVRFVFETLFKGKKLIFWDGIPDLWGDVAYLEQLGLISDIEDDEYIMIEDPEKIVNVARIVRDSYARMDVSLLDTYIERIDGALQMFTLDVKT